MDGFILQSAGLKQPAGGLATVPLGRSNRPQPEKLCYYFGTFNPVHNGHLAVAEAAARQFGFDRVVFVPVYKAPHKDDAQVASFARRYEMLRRACADNPLLTVSDIERRLWKANPGQPSYTIRTIRALQSQNGGRRVPFILGADALKDMPGWHEPRALAESLDMIVAPRGGQRIPRALKINGERVRLQRRKLNIRESDLSSTMVRNRVARGESVADLVPSAVAHLISAWGLYRR